MKGSKPRNVLPGFGLSLGFTLFYLSIIVLIPLTAVFSKRQSSAGRNSGARLRMLVSLPLIESAF